MLRLGGTITIPNSTMLARSIKEASVKYVGFTRHYEWELREASSSHLFHASGHPDINEKLKACGTGICNETQLSTNDTPFMVFTRIR